MTRGPGFFDAVTLQKVLEYCLFYFVWKEGIWNEARDPRREGVSVTAARPCDASPWRSRPKGRPLNTRLRQIEGGPEPHIGLGGGHHPGTQGVL